MDSDRTLIQSRDVNIVVAAEEMRSGQASPSDLVRNCLDRIGWWNDAVKAFAKVTDDSAIQAADALANEAEATGFRSRLHGVPVAFKDFYDTAGVETTAAFEQFRSRLPERDATVVWRLKEAGAIVLGKTNMHTLGMGTTGLESVFGPAVNPWNREYIPGGSSSGSAAAVATGMCYATVDTDAVGSCRLPASCCGVVGFKGSYGRINLDGILAGEQPPDDVIVALAHAGIMARTVTDAAIVFGVLANRNPDDNGADPLESSRKNEELSIGVVEAAAADADVKLAFGDAVRRIERMVRRVKNVEIPAVNLSKGIGSIEQDRNTADTTIFDGVDFIVLPTIPMAVPSVADAQGNPQALTAENTLFANYFGVPAITVPCGFDRNGLPVGLQIVGKPQDDSRVLEFARQFDEWETFSHR